MIFSVNGRRLIGFYQLNLGLMICATVTSFVVDCKIATIEMQLAPSQREQAEKRKLPTLASRGRKLTIRFILLYC